MSRAAVHPERPATASQGSPRTLDVSNVPQQQSGLLDKVGLTSIFDIAVDMTSTFSAQRYVHTTDRRIGVTYRVLQIGVLLYVILMTLNSYHYLKTGPAQGIVTGYITKGTMYSGTSQTYTPTTCTSAFGSNPSCTRGTAVTANVANPPYCSAPYTDQYVEMAEFNYGPVRCSVFAQSSVGFKRTPSYLFVSTLIMHRQFEMRKCSDNRPSCNSGTADVTVVGDSCTCLNVTNYYVVNPEDTTPVYFCFLFFVYFDPLFSSFLPPIKTVPWCCVPTGHEDVHQPRLLVVPPQRELFQRRAAEPLHKTRTFRPHNPHHTASAPRTTLALTLIPLTLPPPQA